MALTLIFLVNVLSKLCVLHRKNEVLDSRGGNAIGAYGDLLVSVGHILPSHCQNGLLDAFLGYADCSLFYHVDCRISFLQDWNTFRLHPSRYHEYTDGDQVW